MGLVALDKLGLVIPTNLISLLLVEADRTGGFAFPPHNRDNISCSSSVCKQVRFDYAVDFWSGAEDSPSFLKRYKLERFTTSPPLKSVGKPVRLHLISFVLFLHLV